ncbi:MAG: hypothetical protein QNL03_03730 [Gammaproteobacteria bacterium]|nr:hypothetical protein [Gammaproteobacteria bacterium]
MAWTTPTGILLAVLLALAAAACSTKEPVLTYKDDIAPIMAQHCVECHSAGNMGAIVSGFDAGSYEKMMKGTKHGLMINPGSAESSPLYLLASGSAAPVIQMKHRNVSPGPEQIETIKLWIDQGAVYLNEK